MITFEGPQCMWTNPSKKSRQGSDPPIQAMPGFWEHMEWHSIPYMLYVPWSQSLFFQQKLSLPMHSGHCDRPGWSSWGFVQRHRGFKLCRGGDGRPSTVRTPACSDGSRGARLLSYRPPPLPLSRWMDCVRHHWGGDCCAFGRHNHTLGSLVHQEGR